jgi:hypothetical protein
MKKRCTMSFGLGGGDQEGNNPSAGGPGGTAGLPFNFTRLTFMTRIAGKHLAWSPSQLEEVPSPRAMKRPGRSSHLLQSVHHPG